MLVVRSTRTLAIGIEINCQRHTVLTRDTIDTEAERGNDTLFRNGIHWSKLKRIDYYGARMLTPLILMLVLF